MQHANHTIPLEEQIAKVAECGIHLRSGVTINDLFASFYERNAYETEPFRRLLIDMGCGIYRDDTGIFDPVSNNIWHLDTECINGSDDYVRIAEKMRDLAGGALPLTGITSEFDRKKKVGEMAFSLEGKGYRWKLRIKQDWVDGKVFSRFASLLAGRKVGKRFTYCDLEGQDCLIGCCTPEQLARLQDVTRMPFQWLT